MKAMILAAGKGTRLKPITDTIPKALVQVNGIPILEIIIKRLISSGFNEIIINVHHLPDKIISFLKSKNNFNINIQISDETDLLLDTGGGLKKAGRFFNDDKPFLLHNVDILSNIDLKKMYQYNLETKALATLFVQNRKSSRRIQFNEEKRFCAWINYETDNKKIALPGQPKYEFAFNCIHVINPDIFRLIENEGVFSIFDLYIKMTTDQKINFYNDPKAKFFDIGTPDQLKKAQDFIF